MKTLIQPAPERKGVPARLKPPRAHACDQCAKSFDEARALKAHRRDKHGET